ncbi:MAG: radical SAM protein, partial [Bdellovibrionales bacterium]|nr:radical SAM protein [Bdellovibrionales bacterium]
VARINALLTEGVKEVVLAGVHIGDYQDDKYGSEPGPEGLIEQILLRTSLPRLRLSSLEPVEVTDRLIELCQDSRICSHFHMSIQSACTPTLQRMKRNYGAAEVEFSLKRIAREFPDAFVGMDFIVGFPGESESEFMDSFTRLSYLPWTKIHVFPYSERPGTYANRLDEKNAPKEIGERAKRLQALSLERHAQAGLNQVGKDKEVLVLKQKDGAYQGLSRDYWPVQIESLKPLTSGEEIRVRIQGFDSSSSLKAKNSLFGVPLDLLSGPEMQASTHS